MKAIRVSQFGGADVLLASEVNTPQASPSQVLIKVEAIGVNPVDALCRSGLMAWQKLPFVPGFDAAGTVVVPDRGGRWANGDHVFVTLTSSCYAEYVCADADRVYRLPPDVDFATGAALGIPYFTAVGALFSRAGLRSNETLLIRGASGAVGMAAVQLAVAHGVRVLATAGTPSGRELVAAHGVRRVFDHRLPSLTAEVLAATEGRGVDVVLELRSEAIGEDIALLAPGGRIVVVGDRTPVTIDPAALTQRSASILGFGVGAFGAGGSMRDEDYRIAHDAIQSGLRNGAIRPQIARRFALQDAAAAHRLLGQHGVNGKIILLP